KGLIHSWDSNSPMCSPEVRRRVLELARTKGWLPRLGYALQQAVPSEVAVNEWEYEWGRRRFVSLAHACRDVFLALEFNDLKELDRLASLCRQDDQIRSLVNALYAVCGEGPDKSGSQGHC
ncbi:MAG: hypothetical protein R6T98_05975, partial [Desulfatiglandales bacterium]